MVCSFLMGKRPHGPNWTRLLAAAVAAASLAALARFGAPRTQDAFFGMLFPQLVWGEATPGEAVAL